MRIQTFKKQLQKGFAFATIMLAVAALGIITLIAFGIVTSISKPSRLVTNQISTRSSINQALMSIARVVSTDTDSYPLPAAGVVVNGDGYDMPQVSGASMTDGWGTKFRYCAWDHGTSTNTGRIVGDIHPNANANLFGVISAGPDKTFNTSCASLKAGTVVGDDIAVWRTLSDYKKNGFGNSWLLDSVDCENSTVPTLDVNSIAANCSSSTSRLDLMDTAFIKEGQQITIRKSGKIMEWQGGGWYQAGGTAAGNYPAPTAFSFAALTNLACGTTVTSAAVQINGIVVGTPISIQGGAYATSLDNVSYGSFTSSVTSIAPGTWVKLQTTISLADNSITSVVLNIGGTEKIWSVTAVTCGAHNYTSGGTYTFTVPANVYSVSSVCIGGGGAGNRIADTTTSFTFGGGGGGLAYKNNIAVTPGQTITITVAAPSTIMRGGVSSFGSLFYASGGYPIGSSYLNQGGSGVGGDANYSGGWGGYGIYWAAATSNVSGGGGGAAGYWGNGPHGSDSAGSAPVLSALITGAGQAGGGYGNNGQGGGGVGFFPVANTSATGGYGGSLGSNAGNSSAGAGYGGGGGGCYTGCANSGGGGAVRIIWPGSGRSYPSSNVGVIGTELSN
jgi:hypothetical protein